MFDIADSLMTALTRARSDLEGAASNVSRAQTQSGGAGRSDRALAAAAGRAVFAEALLNAVHARLSEIKSVAHG